MDAMDKDHLIDRIAGELAAVLDASGPIGAERIVAFVIDRLDATWECEVCGDERPDDLIAVAKASLMTRNSSVIGRNMKYCMDCLLYTSPSPRDRTRSRMPSSA